MDDLIDRKKLINWFSAYGLSFVKMSDVIKAVKDAKAVDAVEVVRCKDCIYAVEIEDKYIHTRFNDGKKQCELGRSFTVLGYSIVSNDGFCDSGERKTDG